MMTMTMIATTITTTITSTTKGTTMMTMVTMVTTWSAGLGVDQDGIEEKYKENNDDIYDDTDDIHNNDSTDGR